MKIYCQFFILLVFTFNLAIGTDFTLSSIDKSEIKPGDIVWIFAQTNESDFDFNSLRNNSLGEYLYVLDIKKMSEGAQLQVIVKESIPKSNESMKNDPPKHKIILNGISYNPEGLKSGQELFNVDIDINFNFNKYKNVYLSIFLILLISLIFFMVIQLKKRKKAKQLFYVNQSELLLQFENAKARQEIEYIASRKRDLFTYFDFDKNDWNKFFDIIDNIQYKQFWTDEELQRGLKALSILKNNLRNRSWNSKI